MTSKRAIAAFWERFAALAPRLFELDDAAAIEQLDRAMEEVGDLSWEAGPHAQGGSFLALSASGPETLRRVGEILAAAPVLPGWTFLGALPRKAWDGSLVFGTGPTARDLDTATWRAVLYKYREPPHDIDLRTDQLVGLDAEDTRLAARLVLVSWLGEALCDRALGDIRVVPDASLLGRGIPLDRLGELLQVRVPSRTPPSTGSARGTLPAGVPAWAGTGVLDGRAAVLLLPEVGVPHPLSVRTRAVDLVPLLPLLVGTCLSAWRFRAHDDIAALAFGLGGVLLMFALAIWFRD